MNKAGNRSWTPDEIIKNWGKGEASLAQVEISPGLFPLHQLLSHFPSPLGFMGWKPLPPPSITLNAALTHHGKSI